ncbi:MAG: amidohydrolase [Acidimicrobiales bacterium]|nr:amidohydrolase [Acidimicrobiales bacterium]
MTAADTAGSAVGSGTGDDTVIYPARRVITMNHAFPFGEAVAVRDGRVLGVGSLAELAAWGPHRVDRSFADLVLLPGFVEAHSHVMSGGMWASTYVGYFDRRDPQGRLWPGCTSIDAVLERLASAAAALDDPARTLLAWGLDPIYFPGERLVARHLDTVTGSRPALVLHASGHLATVNSALMAQCGIDRSATSPGVARGGDGLPNGELHEPAAMMLSGDAFVEMMRANRTEQARWHYAAEARNAGHTLVTDLGTTQLWDPEQLRSWRSATDSPDYPARVMVAMSNLFGAVADPAELADLCVLLRGEQTPKLRFGIVKLILDGSIQGFTARISWPHYFKPPPGHIGNGLWLMPPDQMADLLGVYHRAGLTVHCHCNGDEAAEVFIDAVETVLERHSRWDHRHTVQHCQLATAAQYRRMAALGMHANIFANHIYYWGDQHRDVTVGPERAARMNACATALASGVDFSIHSDAPLTPLGHLHTAWCAVNRVTASGEVLGPDERISVADALHAATIGAAAQIKLDAEIGSIEAGKLADFAVLGDDPLSVDPMALRDIEVWGTVLGGVLQPSTASP